jgi:hypothetical protein
VSEAGGDEDGGEGWKIREGAWLARSGGVGSSQGVVRFQSSGCLLAWIQVGGEGMRIKWERT